MSKIDSSELIDIFQQEMTKKKKKEDKKKQKLEKKFEKQENLEFEKIAKEEFKKQIEAKKQENLTKEETEEKQSKRKSQESKKEIPCKETITIHHFLYDTTFGFFLILLFLCTLGYSSFLLYSNFNINNIIKSSLLILFALSYILSLTIQKTNIKKLAAMISSIAICLLMVFLIYIA